MAELKPCPFCGGTNIVMRDVSGMFGKSAYARTYHYMQCRDCMSQTGYHGTKPKTIEAWNRRAGYIALEDIVDLDSQTAANNEAMRKVIAFMAGGAEDGK